ncbi:MAG: flagellar biosynthesis anti-sigma factor FlgM [Chitinispirillales bacterium]|jgi:anti-sigma28 factor (negative regulator of flagellin synthesis)|nr:flagellar biosynthesis anti-sigma factor FlgM [Chitinispirillales bacterium]
MPTIGQISGNIYTAAYEPKSANAKESNTKRDEKLKDSVALSNRVSAGSSDDKNIAALKRIVESHENVRVGLVTAIKAQVDSGNYLIEDKIDKISDSIINSMFA